MAYRLSLIEEAGESVRACAREELATAASLLGDEFHHDPVEAVHEARKSLKKMRALLRLVRPGLPKRIYRRENATLRDAGRLVSGARDADVMVETVEALADRYAGRIPSGDFEALRDHLRSEALAGRASAAAEDGRVRAVSMLDGVAARIDDWPLDDAGWAAIAAGMERAYRAGRHAFAAARADPTVERLHDWRKRVKDLWYHERLIEPAWPDVLSAQAEAAHRLSEILGDDHDLAVLAELVCGAPVPLDPAPLRELIAERRAELQAAARQLGSLIYAERPKAFRRRIRRLLKAARAAQAVEAVDGGRV